MILIFTGEGKGKTTAATGQAVRAHGSGLTVAFCQFMKRPDMAGEQKVLARLLGENFAAFGVGFFRNETDRAKHRRAAERTLAWARDKLEYGADMLVLDEILYALGHALVSLEEIEELITLAEIKNRHLVLTGRGLPEQLAQKADLITEMRPVKHPHDSGIPAQKGIEY